jgi:hypothetical protein
MEAAIWKSEPNECNCKEYDIGYAKGPAYRVIRIHNLLSACLVTSADFIFNQYIDLGKVVHGGQAAFIKQSLMHEHEMKKRRDPTIGNFRKLNKRDFAWNDVSKFPWMAKNNSLFNQACYEVN